MYFTLVSISAFNFNNLNIIAIPKVSINKMIMIAPDTMPAMAPTPIGTLPASVEVSSGQKMGTCDYNIYEVHTLVTIITHDGNSCCVGFWIHLYVSLCC